MKSKTVLLIGSGHLAYRVKGCVAAKGFSVVHLPHLLSPQEEHVSTIGTVAVALEGLDLALLQMVYVLDDKDENNLEMLIALTALQPTLRITTSLFNEAVRPHLEQAYPNLCILNPARLAAPRFAEALYTPVAHQKKFAFPPPAKPARRQSDNLIYLLMAAFAGILLLAAAYFHFAEGLSWLDAFYFVVVTVATVGYGDISLQHASAMSKLAGIALILSSTVFVWLIFSLTIDRIIKQRVQRSLGRKKYPYKNHIILCGLGRLGYFVAEELQRRGERLVIIEASETSAASEHFRGCGVAVYTGNARLPKVLQDAGVAQARALVSTISDDYANLEIGLNARAFQPGLKLILRIFDEAMAQTIKENLDIHLTLSMSAIVDEAFAERLEKANENSCQTGEGD